MGRLTKKINGNYLIRVGKINIDTHLPDLTTAAKKLGQYENIDTRPSRLKAIKKFADIVKAKPYQIAMAEFYDTYKEYMESFNHHRQDKLTEKEFNFLKKELHK